MRPQRVGRFWVTFTHSLIVCYLFSCLRPFFGKMGIILVPTSDGAETIKCNGIDVKHLEEHLALSNSQQTLAVIILVQLLYFTEENIKVEEYEVQKVPPTQWGIVFISGWLLLSGTLIYDRGHEAREDSTPLGHRRTEAHVPHLVWFSTISGQITALGQLPSTGEARLPPPPPAQKWAPSPWAACQQWTWHKFTHWEPFVRVLSSPWAFPPDIHPALGS